MIEETDQLVVASNRGPVSWRRDHNGRLLARRGFGGLVTALGGALQQEPGTWVSVALSEHDREVAARHDGKPFTVEAEGAAYRLRLLDVGERYDPYYNDVANRLLWFTLHGLWSEPGSGGEEHDTPGSAGSPAHASDPSMHAGAGAASAAWDEAFVPVNEQVAEAVVDAAEGGAEVFLEDYHLLAAARCVRAQLPRAPLLLYVHTPWPEPRELARLPGRIAREIMRSMLAADVVAFSSPAWSGAFRRCAETLAGAVVDGDAVGHEHGETVVADFVLGVDEDDLRAAAASRETQAAAARLEQELDGRRLLLRVDRTDLSKNILRGLLAYELLLERHPEHQGRVLHYAHLNPSRQRVPEYQRYLAACMAAAERVQERFGEDSLRVFVGDDHPMAVAALRRFDVLLANPVTDGTNLVAKEGAVLNERDGVVVLSRTAGAADVLGDGALLVDPRDVEGQARQLHRALCLPADERAARAARLREAARIGKPQEWFEAQRRLLREVASARV